LGLEGVADLDGFDDKLCFVGVDLSGFVVVVSGDSVFGVLDVGGGDFKSVFSGDGEDTIIGMRILSFFEFDRH